MTAARTQSRIELPRRQRRYGFALTPLADAMFQLLVFFMLSANLTPYSLLGIKAGTIGSGAPGDEAATRDQQSGAPALAPGETAVWSVSRDSIAANGQRFSFDALPQLAEAMRAAGTARVLLVTRDDARVQGLVSVLEVLAAQGMTDVQIAGGAGTRAP